MITAIKNIKFPNTSVYNINNKTNKTDLFTQPLKNDSVSFSSNAITLSPKSIKTVTEFANKLELNKIYKFKNPKSEKFEIASFSHTQTPNKRSLIIMYKEYPKNNIIKQLNLIINSSGEVFESGVPVKKTEDIRFYENLIPEIISEASKKLKKV